MADELIPEAPDEEAIAEYQERFRKDPRCERLLRSALEQVGVVAARTYWDSVYLRIVPPTSERSIGTIGFHRDTWSSNVLQQTNWWLPMRPLSEERTIAFYPRLLVETDREHERGLGPRRDPGAPPGGGARRRPADRP